MADCVKKWYVLRTAGGKEKKAKEYLENDFEPDIPGETCSFEDYIEEFGYSGEIYACFNEFVENDYHADA